MEPITLPDELDPATRRHDALWAEARALRAEAHRIWLLRDPALPPEEYSRIMRQYSEASGAALAKEEEALKAWG